MQKSMIGKKTKALVQAIHDSQIQTVLVTAGAGTKALSDLLSIGGASRTLLEALVPYSQASFDDFLGQTPKQYVDGETARLLAGRAYTRARWLLGTTAPIVGLACTATIATDREKRGDHRAHIAAWQSERLIETSIYLEKGARDRAGEENLISLVLLNAIATAANLHQKLDLPLKAGDQIQRHIYDFSTETKKLLGRQINYFGLDDNGEIHGHTNPKVLLSGSFNPLHDGHLGMAEAAAHITDGPIAFELSTFNVDKPPLPIDVTLDRVAQFAGRHTIFVSNAPTYLEKAQLYPNTTFVIGYDTAVRVFEPKYYQDSHKNMRAALETIRQHGCNFLVAGRADQNGAFRDLTELEVPPDFADLFRPIPERQFRRDISSSHLRQTNQRGSR